jgi:hypothetical protein
VHRGRGGEADCCEYRLYEIRETGKVDLTFRGGELRTKYKYSTYTNIKHSVQWSRVVNERLSLVLPFVLSGKKLS